MPYVLDAMKSDVMRVVVHHTGETRAEGNGVDVRNGVEDQNGVQESSGKEREAMNGHDRQAGPCHAPCKHEILVEKLRNKMIHTDKLVEVHKCVVRELHEARTALSSTARSEEQIEVLERDKAKLLVTVQQLEMQLNALLSKSSMVYCFPVLFKGISINFL